MSQATSGWQVLDADAGVLTYTYTFKGGLANAFAARLDDGTMFVLSPPRKQTEDDFAKILEFGDVSAVAANNGWHYLGQPEWRARFPDARYFAPEAAMARIAKKCPEAGPFEPISALQPLLGDNVGVTEARGTRCGEAWAWAKVDGGYAWYASDILANFETLPKSFFERQLFKLSGSAPGFRVFHLAMLAIVKDRKGVLEQFASDLGANPASIIVPGHGGVLSEDGLSDDAKRLVERALS